MTIARPLFKGTWPLTEDTFSSLSTSRIWIRHWKPVRFPQFCHHRGDTINVLDYLRNTSTLLNNSRVLLKLLLVIRAPFTWIRGGRGRGCVHNFTLTPCNVSWAPAKAPAAQSPKGQHVFLADNKIRFDLTPARAYHAALNMGRCNHSESRSV